MKFKADCAVEFWISNIEVEADSEEAAKAELNNLSLENLLESGNVKEISIKDADFTVIEDTVKVRVYNIVDHAHKDIEEEFTFEITCTPGDEDDAISDALYDYYKIDTTRFDWEIIE